MHTVTETTVWEVKITTVGETDVYVNYGKERKERTRVFRDFVLTSSVDLDQSLD